MEERLKERRSARMMLATVTWGKRAALVAVIAAVAWILLLSPVFALDTSKVETSGYGTVVDPAEVEQIVATHEGSSLALMNVGHLENQLSDLVGVRDAQVTRVWPAGLRIELTSSEPVAAIPQAGGGYVLVDDLGAQVDSRKKAPAHLPVITIPVGTGDTRILDGVLGVIDVIPVALRDRVEGIEASTEDSISFVLRDGPRVEWGSGEDSALKAEVLQVLLNSEEGASADVIDVSAPSLPITREG